FSESKNTDNAEEGEDEPKESEELIALRAAAERINRGAKMAEDVLRGVRNSHLPEALVKIIEAEEERVRKENEEKEAEKIKKEENQLSENCLIKALSAVNNINENEVIKLLEENGLDFKKAKGKDVPFKEAFVAAQKSGLSLEGINFIKPEQGDIWHASDASPPEDKQDNVVDIKEPSQIPDEAYIGKEDFDISDILSGITPVSSSARNNLDMIIQLAVLEDLDGNKVLSKDAIEAFTQAHGLEHIKDELEQMNDIELANFASGKTSPNQTAADNVLEAVIAAAKLGSPFGKPADNGANDEKTKGPIKAKEIKARKRAPKIFVSETAKAAKETHNPAVVTDKVIRNVLNKLGYAARPYDVLPGEHTHRFIKAAHGIPGIWFVPDKPGSDQGRFIVAIASKSEVLVIDGKNKPVVIPMSEFRGIVYTSNNGQAFARVIALEPVLGFSTISEDALVVKASTAKDREEIKSSFEITTTKNSKTLISRKGRGFIRSLGLDSEQIMSIFGVDTREAKPLARPALAGDRRAIASDSKYMGQSADKLAIAISITVALALTIGLLDFGIITVISLSIATLMRFVSLNPDAPILKQAASMFKGMMQKANIRNGDTPYKRVQFVISLIFSVSAVIIALFGLSFISPVILFIGYKVNKYFGKRMLWGTGSRLFNLTVKAIEKISYPFSREIQLPLPGKIPVFLDISTYIITSSISIYMLTWWGAPWLIAIAIGLFGIGIFTLFHELGHLIFVKLFKAGPKEIVIRGAVGVVAFNGRMNWIKHSIESASGPAMNFLLGYVLLSLSVLLGDYSPVFAALLYWSAIMNFYQAAVNINPLPAFDGGKITERLGKALKRLPGILGIISSMLIFSGLIISGYITFNLLSNIITIIGSSETISIMSSSSMKRFLMIIFKSFILPGDLKSLFAIGPLAFQYIAGLLATAWFLAIFIWSTILYDNSNSYRRPRVSDRSASGTVRNNREVMAALAGKDRRNASKLNLERIASVWNRLANELRLHGVIIPRAPPTEDLPVLVFKGLKEGGLIMTNDQGEAQGLFLDSRVFTKQTITLEGVKRSGDWIIEHELINLLGIEEYRGNANHTITPQVAHENTKAVQAVLAVFREPFPANKDRITVVRERLENNPDVPQTALASNS
ncbi:MAG: hypothetical protein JW867_00560, partial [Candidatus Omnitrophica bacterium]|nr:hypothetical protein [Candidatus Omnitrophota bacterium]